MNTCDDCRFGKESTYEEPCKSCLAYKAEEGFEGEIFPNWKPKEKK